MGLSVFSRAVGPTCLIPSVLPRSLPHEAGSWDESTSGQKLSADFKPVSGASACATEGEPVYKSQLLMKITGSKVSNTPEDLQKRSDSKN